VAERLGGFGQVECFAVPYRAAWILGAAVLAGAIELIWVWVLGKEGKSVVEGRVRLGGLDESVWFEAALVAVSGHVVVPPVMSG
jgi:hypothetical protein